MYTLNDKVTGLKPYEPIQGDYRIRLDANESFLELAQDTKKAMLERISRLPLNRYPDPLASEACGMFARYHNISPELVTAGNGSDELLSIISQAFLKQGEKAVFLSPDFSMYSFYSSLAGAQVLHMEKENGRVDVDKVVAFVNQHGARLLIFSNPCNPTGLGTAREDVLRLCAQCPECLVVIDEAYMDFWNQSVIDRVEELDNAIVLRTCSKAFRLAGIRCGFAVAGSRLTNVLRAVKSPYNVSSLTQAAAAEVMSRVGELKQAIATVIDSRDRLVSALMDIAAEHPGKLSLSQSAANFAYVNMPGDAARKMFEALEQNGIIVRCFNGALRVTAGAPEENAEFLRVFEENLDAVCN